MGFGESRNPFSNQVNSLIIDLIEYAKLCVDSRNPFSNQVNSLYGRMPRSKDENGVVIPSQIRSIHSIKMETRNEILEASRNPFSNQVNSLK